MRPYIVRRVLLIIPLIWGVVSSVFLVVHLLPGDPAAVLLGPFATSAREEGLRHMWGLDQPLLVQYVHYLGNIVVGRFGVSFLTGQPATYQILSALPYTVVLGLTALVIAVGAGVPLGIVAAVRSDTLADRLSLILSLLLVSAPSFLVGIVLLIVFSGELGWLPSIGAGTFPHPGSILVHTILPAIALSAGLLAYLTRITRTTLLSVLRDDYVRTARAKGLARRAVVYRHAVRNALLPVLSILGLAAGDVVGGTVVIETVFARPGIGSLLVNSVTGRDYIQVQACVIVLAASFVVMNLVTDLCYAVADPRIQYQ
ncbi:MAG TPA: ABC transporter permease [bacterium]|nr:ABC transporter permease [bacterium]